MIRISPGSDEHEKYKKLCALAVAGSLSPLEMIELQAHLKVCDECDDVFYRYQSISTLGMTALAEEYEESQEQLRWDSTPIQEELLERVRADLGMAQEQKSRPYSSHSSPNVVRPPAKSFAWMAVAAALILALVGGAYHLGVRSQHPVSIQLPSMSADNRLEQLSDEKNQADQLLAEQARKIAELQAESAEKAQELGKLKAALHDLEDRSNKLQATSNQSDAQLAALTQQRDTLSVQLQNTNQAYENDKIELASLRKERDSTLLRTSSLETKVADLTAVNRDQERRLNDTQQYLSSDRDIRELMGARKLYIADVFDVDSSSRTQKPFGRVFYTQGKSLIFYAFDLDREPGVVSASTFQVWGQREAPQGQQALPMNLGILYMDNETNRRWVMRFDDPKKLSEIDAVFVTVEPRGGSHKPTTKPFLYALLRNEANHP
jgi:Anti-sigma-K factor rskA